jgi:hypothetical protein
MEEEYFMLSIDGEEYGRVTQHAGVKTTICKNRFEIICRERAEVNEQVTIKELKDWLAKRKQDAMRDNGNMPEEVP